MLVQSHQGRVELLSALPKAWPDGSVTGYRARGGFEVALTWKHGRLVTATLHSILGNLCKVSYLGKSVSFPTWADNTYRLAASLEPLSP